MQKVDRWVGVGIAAFALAVLWSSHAFPNVPGQKLGASTLPTIVGVCLLVCGLLLLLRSRSAARYVVEAPSEPENPLLAGSPGSGEPGREQVRPALGILAAIALYIVAADPLGYLLVAPVCLVIAQLSLGVRLAPAIGWSVLAAVAVHVSFYKLLKVPLPWGVLPPLY